MTTPARRRTRIAGLAVAALAAGLALQPMLAAPAQAGINCDGPQLPIIGPTLNDCVAPESVITLKPAHLSFTPAAVFEITTEAPDADDPSVTFECKIEEGAPPEVLVPVPGQPEGWTDCSVLDEPDGSRSLGRVEYLDLAPADYTFSVRASDVPTVDFLGDTPNVEQTPATYSWEVVDDTPTDQDLEGFPDTTITKHPKRWHLFPYAEVRFEADEPAMGYQCHLDGQRVPCEENGRAHLTGMGAGDHVFEVAAYDMAGNLDRSPARVEWMIPRNNLSLKKHSRGDWELRRKRGHFLDTISQTRAKGAFIRQGTKGVRELVLVATTCPKCGKLEATFAGKKLTTVNLRSKKQKPRRLITLGTWRKPQNGRLELTVVSKNKRVIVEGLGFTLRRSS